MSRAKGTANLAASLEVLAGAPLDAREKVPTKADLYLAANFPYPYVGLETYVAAENKKYRLVGNDVTVEANWEEVGSGGGGTTVVANPEGEATDELEKLQVGNDIYSIPEENVEISKAQFDALPAATKNNGKAYYIPDANLVSNFTVMGNRFDKANIYDTTERMVGRWIDGKPLYQKTLQCNANVTGSMAWATIVSDVSDLHIDMLVGSGIMTDPATASAGPYFMQALYTRVNPSDNSLQVFCQGGGHASTITIQYTKTTDASVAIGTENDYSTDEMIIGTWIDGKPVYQKTISCNATLTSGMSWATIVSDVSDLNVDQIVGGFMTDKYSATSTTMMQGLYIQVNNNALKVFSQGGGHVSNITIQYTKTTD